jgi:hypothetical protein
MVCGGFAAAQSPDNFIGRDHAKLQWAVAPADQPTAVPSDDELPAALRRQSPFLHQQ